MWEALQRWTGERFCRREGEIGLHPVGGLRSFIFHHDQGAEILISQVWCGGVCSVKLMSLPC